jgi:hypothetical protein
MTPSARLAALATAAIFFANPLASRAQTADLPSAPDAPSKPVFRLPPATPITVAAPTGTPPSPPDQETDDCYAAAEGIYAKQKPFPPALQREVDRYEFLAMHRIKDEWVRHMPFSTKDPWLKDRLLAVRFAVMPDGSIDTPIVTMRSGHENYDKHAVDSIIASAPFAPLPAGVTHPLPMCFRFSYYQGEPPAPPKPKPIDLWPGTAKSKRSAVATQPADSQPK